MKARLPYFVDVVETVDGTWMVLVSGYQWGQSGNPDKAGAYSQVWATKESATAAILAFLSVR